MRIGIRNNEVKTRDMYKAVEDIQLVERIKYSSKTEVRNYEK